jgi:hypothetical protein
MTINLNDVLIMYNTEEQQDTVSNTEKISWKLYHFM